MMTSSLLVGTLEHARTRPKQHAFDYEVFHLLVDLDDLPRLDREVTGFGHNRAAPLSLHDIDHLGDVDLPLRTKLARWLDGQGAQLPGGRVLLQTAPRVLGRVFNPVSWWWCFDAADELALVVAEVNNTFGDTHGYVLDDLTADRAGQVRAETTKRFHVSPFMPIDGQEYDFAFRPPSAAGADEAVVTKMRVRDADGPLFHAALHEQRQELTTGALWRAVARTPLLTAKTVAGIHWEAARIWLGRKAPFHRRPEPPDAGLAAVANDRLVSAGAAEADRPAAETEHDNDPLHPRGAE